MDISVVIPVYGCRAALYELYERLCKTLESICKTFEIIFVEDNCPQNSWQDIRAICEKDERVVALKMSRNFGQIKAITAGLDTCKGDWIVVMDCDLQDRPEGICDLYQKAQEGYDVVFAKRKERKDSFITKFLSKSFYKVYDYFTDGKFDNTICNFSISNRKVINQYCKMREHNRAYTMFIKWLGFKQVSIEVQADERYEGKSSYDLRRKLKMASSIITSQSNKPLMISVKLGFSIATIAFIYIIYLIIRHIVVQDIIVGWTSIVASIYLMGGVLLGAIGIVGIYIGNIFEEVKNRPLYVITERLNYKE